MPAEHALRTRLPVALVASLLCLVAPGLTSAQLPFGGTLTVSGTPGDSRMPHMVVGQAGVLHVAWADDTGSPGVYRILHKRSFDGGQTFTAALQISTGLGAALRARLATHGNAVHAVWMQDPDTAPGSDTKEIMYARSLDGGASFSAPVNLSESPGQSQEARLAVTPSGAVLVVWDEAFPSRHIALRRSLDGGATFGGDQTPFPVVMTTSPLPDAPTGAKTPYPGIAVDPSSGRVYLVWHDLVNGNLQVLFSRSVDGGQSFSAPLNISNAGLHAHCASMTVGPSGKVLVAWENRKQMDPHAHDATFARSVDGGVTFSAPINLSNGPPFAFSDYPWPSEAPNGLIVVGWEDNTAGGGLDAVVAASTNGGASFSPSQNVSNNPDSTSTEVVTLFGPDGTLYILWEDFATGAAEILLRRAVGVGRGGPPTPPPPPIVTGPGPGGAPVIHVFGGAATAGSLMAYDSRFAGGVFVALGDVDGSGDAEVITGAGQGGGPHVRVLKADGTDLGIGFFAYDSRFVGGVRVASCDVDGDGRAEIVTAAGPGGGPHVRVWKVIGTTVTELFGFFAYSPAYAGGVFVGCGDVDGDGRGELITGADAGGGPHVRVWSLGSSGLIELAGFFAYNPGFTGGVRVAAADVDGDGRADIITGAGPGGGPHVRVLRLHPGPTGMALAGLLDFFAYDPAFAGGVFVAGGNLDGTGGAEIVTGAGAGGGPHVRAFTAALTEVAGFFAYDPRFTGGVTVAVDPTGATPAPPAPPDPGPGAPAPGPEPPPGLQPPPPAPNLPPLPPPDDDDGDDDEGDGGPGPH